jgi:HK97 family phage major capsid protein
MTDGHITRTNADALINPEIAQEIIKDIPLHSASLQLMRRLPNMSTKVRHMPILTQMPMAGFVDGDVGLKSTSTAEWDKLSITAEEIAVIIPIPEAVLDDADYDIWAEIRPLIAQAFGQVIDGAVFFSVDKPSTWPAGLVPTAIAKSKTVVHGTGVDIAADVNGLMALIEAQGMEVNGFAGDVSVKSLLRGLRDLNQGLLFQPSLTADTPNTLYAQPLDFVKNGSWNPATALLLGGDWSKTVYSIRQDLTYKILDQAVISDGDGKVILNLAQQDAVAMRVVMRLGWQMANPIRPMSDLTDTSRYPFAVIQPKSV